MPELIERVPTIDWVLVAGVLVAALFALPTSRRGGRYRGLPGWVGFWVLFAALLMALDHAPRPVSFSLLAAAMFATLRGYFFVAPVRLRDRWAILASYLAIPFALWPAYLGSSELFLATVPVSLFLIIPVFLALGPVQEGMLDSTGRTLLGVAFFVFCTAHLGLLVDVRPELLPGREPEGLPQLFGILVLAAELPRRLAGDFVPGERGLRPGVGVLIALAPVIGLGHWLAPLCGMVDDDGARAGALVALAVTLGALVSKAVTKDLAMTTSSALVGRGALLSRVVPAVYAAPVFYHYLHLFS